MNPPYTLDSSDTVDTLRNIAKWSECQDENHFHPLGRSSLPVSTVIALYVATVRVLDVDDLDTVLYDFTTTTEEERIAVNYVKSVLLRARS